VEPVTWIVRAEAVGYVEQQTTATVSLGATTADVNFALEAEE
jgi:hypothetical protein